ncbi:MAG: sulfotransferase domain-containing protein [Bacteroidota bacterium]
MSAFDSSLFPDFLIIGAGKSGTTSLDNYLKQHPEIFISSRKEPNFFGYEFSKESDFDTEDERIHFVNSVTKIEDYLNLFADADDHHVKGETSNTYLYHDIAPERIKRYIPNVRLMAIFRNPAERLYSRFLHLARDNRMPTESFNDCFDKTSVWWKRNDLVKEGFYFKHISRYFELFERESIKVFFYEDLRDNSKRLLKEMYEFLDVDSSFEAIVDVEYNRSGLVKNEFYDKLFGQKSMVKDVVKKILPKKGFENLKQNRWAQKQINDLRSKNLHRPKLDPELKSRLINEIYFEDILKLQELLKVDLSHWGLNNQSVR